MAFDPREFRVEMAKSLLEGARANYNENTRINGVIDDKAQKVAGIAGVFLAAALAFIKVDNLSVWPFNRIRVMVLLALAIVLVICSIAFCLTVLWVRSFPGMPTLASLQDLQSDLFNIAETDLHLYETSYWQDRARVWEAILKEQDSAITTKGRWLFRAQFALGLAMLTIALLLFAIVGPIGFQRWRVLR